LEVARISRRLKTALFVEAVAVPAVLLYLTPHWPRTVLGWAFVILFGPPLWFLAEGLSEWVRGITPDDTVTAVVCGLLFLMLLAGGYVVFSMLLGDYLRPHFY
jgi:hypothetical protein